MSEVSRLSLLPEGSAQMLDRYQLIGEIASGGMASVYLARLPGVGGFSRMVAIKRLHPHLAAEREFVEMFLDEARLAASIHHRNVVPILEIGSSGLGYYLVMEYIEGVTLAKLMTHASVTQRPIPRPVLLRVAVDTLSGLHAAHELVDEQGNLLGVVHRDCSPQNILIGLDGCTRITDFGIARARSRLHTTREGSMKGKLAYMAPEQTQGDGFDRRADLFSVGVVLWEILAEVRLFKGTTEAETLKRLLHDPIPPLRSVMPDVPPALDAVCERALARDPAHRFATAAEMADAIETAAAASGAPIASEREVESLMKARYGDHALVQRDAVRSWLQSTPTTIGPRGPVSDPGWMGRERSAVAPRPVGGRPTIDRPGSWPAPDEVDRGAPLTAVVGETDAATVERPRDESETTNIYDPPSASGDILALLPPSGPVFSDPKPSLPIERRGRWLLVVAALLAVVTAGALILRTTRGPSSAKAPEPAAPEAPEAPETPAETPTGPGAPEGLELAETTAEDAKVEIEPAPEPAAKPVATAPVPKRRPRAAPPPAKPKEAPPPKLPDEADDLSNPYR